VVTVLTAGMTIDDAFAIHVIVLPENAGIPEGVVLSGYVSAIVWYLFRFRRDLISGDASLLFIVSMFFLELSLGLDAISRPFPFAASAEDLAKLMGITAWLYFFFRSACGVVARASSCTGAKPNRAPIRS
jgi:hypothetical protein